jgi:hypothetical protein
MNPRLHNHTLMVIFLHDALKAREITIEQLADLLAPTEENTIRSWFDGRSAPVVSDLLLLAEALRMSPVELTCGWLIDQMPLMERTVRKIALDPLESRFPKSSDLDLRAPVHRPSTKVEDPFDARVPGSPIERSASGRVRKAAPGSRKLTETRSPRAASTLPQ